MPIRYNINNMQLIAGDYGGRCLSKEYIDNVTPLEWICEKGHRWDMSYIVIRQGGWCPRCAKKELNVQERYAALKAIAIERGGKLLSESYAYSHTKMKWQCKEGHQWFARPGDVKNKGNWCRRCAGTERLSLQDMINEAAKHGGKCLSEKYISIKNKLEWECQHGHRWYAMPGSIRNNGTWCKRCAGLEKHSLQQMIDAAAEQGGKCLSNKYINSASPLKWECAKGHQWYASGNAIKNKYSWCPHCAGVAKPTMSDIIKTAAKNGGKCLSKKYINSVTKLKWQCAEGHIWMADPRHILYRGQWCPKCGYERAGYKKRINIESYRSIAKAHGGILLSETCINAHQSILLQCKEGHQWSTKAYSITQGHWCPSCANKIRIQNLPHFQRKPVRHSIK